MRDRQRVGADRVGNPQKNVMFTALIRGRGKVGIYWISKSNLLTTTKRSRNSG